MNSNLGESFQIKWPHHFAAAGPGYQHKLTLIIVTRALISSRLYVGVCESMVLQLVSTGSSFQSLSYCVCDPPATPANFAPIEYT